MCSLNIQTTPPSFPKPPIAVGMTGIAPLDHVRAIPTAWKMAGNSHGDFGDLLGFFSAVRPKTRIAYAVRLNQKRQDRAAKKTIDDQLRAMRGPDYRLGMIPEQLHSLEKVSDSYGSPLCIDRSSPPPQQIALARACVLQKTETVRRCYPVNIDANDFDLLLSALQMLESAQASLGADAVTQGFDNYQRHRTLPQIGERVVTLEYRRWLDYLVRCLVALGNKEPRLFASFVETQSQNSQCSATAQLVIQKAWDVFLQWPPHNNVTPLLSPTGQR